MTDDAGNDLPIIQVGAQAPTSAEAAKLASAAITGLRSYLHSEAALERIPEADQLQINGLASQATTETRGPSGLIALLVVTVVLALGCLGILGVVALIRGWRAVKAREERGDDGIVAVSPTPDTRLVYRGPRIGSGSSARLELDPDPSSSDDAAARPLGEGAAPAELLPSGESVAESPRQELSGDQDGQESGRRFRFQVTRLALDERVAATEATEAALNGGPHVEIRK